MRYAAVDDVAALPYLHASVGYKFGSKFRIDLGGDGMVLPEDWMVDAGITLTWQFHPRWELLGGYQFYDREISTQEIRNRVAYDIPFLAVASSW